jgi:lysyl-tRNA synthetase class 2
MSSERISKLERLKDRAHMLAAARSFFLDRGILEVDCPLLSASASVDAHIDLIPASPYSGKRFLHSSPEYGMKRLLSEGLSDIFQLSHVFRDGEYGPKHNPEFMMAEWYRLGMPFFDLIQESVDFISIFLGKLSYQVISYRELFLHYLSLDYLTATTQELVHCLHARGIEGITERDSKDALLNVILGTLIEPQLGHDGLCVLTDYPASQAALAQKRWNGEEEVAERFEIYYRGVELANGYHELTDFLEQRARLLEANRERLLLGKESLPIDEPFLEALQKGLPDCCGVAVGFDRLMLLRHQVPHMRQILPFSWEEA